jgi:hypothetical protein
MDCAGADLADFRVAPGLRHEQASMTLASASLAI